jgi:hypothetical protein
MTVKHRQLLLLSVLFFLVCILFVQTTPLGSVVALVLG